MDLPDRIGRYRVTDVIGTGAFATVYRATDPRIGGQVAIKVLAENHNLDPAIRERFLTEARVLRRIDSEYVVRLYDLDETDRKQPYLVLGYADRGAIAARVRTLRAQGWDVSAGELANVARQLASALDAVHRVQVVHRDLSPGNVLLRTDREQFTDTDDLLDDIPSPATPTTPSTLLSPDERVVLADLGLCKDLALNSGVTVAGGTEGFRAPEQREGAMTVTPSTDLWGLSALTVWLVTGRPPEPGSVTEAVARAGLPERLGVALERSLRTAPEERHPDVWAWLAEVETALGVTAPSVAGAPAGVPATTVPSTRRSPGMWVAVAGALVAGALLAWGGLALSDRDDDQAPTETVEADEWDGEFSVAGQLNDLAGGEALAPVPDNLPLPAGTEVESSHVNPDEPWNWRAFLTHPAAEPADYAAFFTAELDGAGWEQVGERQVDGGSAQGQETEWVRGTFEGISGETSRYELRVRVETLTSGDVRAVLQWHDQQQYLDEILD